MQTRNSFLGPKSYQDFSETGPWSVVYLSMSNIRATKTTNYNRGNTINGKPVVFIVTQKAKNFNWPEENQFALYKHDRGAELGTTNNKSS